MSVVEGKRRESKTEFERAYSKIYKDCIRLVINKFGGDKTLVEFYSQWIETTSNSVTKAVCDICRFIRIANSIYPEHLSEYEERRIAQDKAIGLCYFLLTQYESMMELLEVSDNKYVDEIKNLRHEINCLKKWRKSDKDRFKNLG